MFADVQGAQIHFSDSGQGAPVLFLHGIPDTGSVWQGVTRPVSRSFRCIAPDLPGFGLSAVPARFRVTLNGMADFVDAFVAAAGIDEPVHLVVHDIGGPYGLAWAVKYPEKVSSIGILNTVFQSEYRWHRYGRICRTPVLGELLQVLTTQSGLARALRSNSGTVKPDRAHISNTYQGFTALVRRMVLKLYRGLDPAVFQPWDQQLRTLASTIPSLVLWGDRDGYIDSTFAERFGAQCVEHFPDCGHWPMLEIPQVVADRLLDHLCKTERQPAARRA